MIPMDEHSACPGDLVGVGIFPNGVIGVPDLLALLAAWGPCQCCAADLNGDEAVDVEDLLILLANWGPCPGTGGESQTLSEVLDEAELTQQQFEAYLTVMAGTDEREQYRWNCWFNNYIMQCVNCPTCPGSDPFAD